MVQIYSQIIFYPSPSSPQIRNVGVRNEPLTCFNSFWEGGPIQGNIIDQSPHLQIENKKKKIVII
jgi:hypothetical protein